MKKSKILFFAESATLSHVTRPYMLAKTLDPLRYEVHFAASSAYAFLLDQSGFHQHEITSVSTADFARRLAAGRPLYSAATLHDYVREDLAIIKKVAPDFIIGDFRLSLSASARLAKVPYACIANAYWSEYSTSLNYPVPELPLMRLLGVRLVERVFPVILPLAFYFNLRPYVQLQKAYGLPAPSCLRAAYTNADYVLYPELPALAETANLPAHHLYIKPLLWAPDIPLPAWAEQCRQSPKKKVFVSLGSSGDVGTLKTMMSALLDLDFNVLLATAGRTDLGPLPDGCHVEAFVNGNEAAKWADLVVCNGGSLSLYQALAGGAPVIGICSNMDQFFSMTQAVAKEVGVIIRASAVSKKSLTAAIASLERMNARAKAAPFAADLDSCDQTAFQTFLDARCGRRA